MKQLLNLYPITGVTELETEYRLIEIIGLHDSPDDPDLIHENAGALVGQVASRLRCPTALIRQSGEYRLAVPADREFDTFEVQIRPDVVRLEPWEDTHRLAFGSLTPEQIPIAQQMLAAELRAPLRQDQRLWSSYGSFFFKRPKNIRDDKRDIDIFMGFGFRVVPFEGTLYVSLDLTTKFVETQWMIDAYDEAALYGLRMRHALYLYGQRWYPIQFLGLTGQSIREQGFVPNHGGRPATFTSGPSMRARTTRRTGSSASIRPRRRFVTGTQVDPDSSSARWLCAGSCCGPMLLSAAAISSVQHSRRTSAPASRPISSSASSAVHPSWAST